jgi:uncharacterized protein YgbK (DUF1537 family)
MSEQAAGTVHALRKSEVLARLPAPWPDEDLREHIRRRHLERAETLVVVDDDPTGCQTVADVPLLFDWSTASLSAELAANPAVLYVLTNSRAIPAPAANRLNRELATNLRAAAAQAARAFSVISRSDSTLRGHFPAETDGLAAGLGPFDGILLAPYFAEGGRLTIDDIHYVQRGADLIPAAATEFARDPVFGYASSNLRAWAEQKSGGRWAAAEIPSLSLDDIRLGGPGRVAERLAQCSGGMPMVVNAACDRDLEVVAWALIQPEVRPRALLPRTAASFVKVRAGLPDRPLLSIDEIGLDKTAVRRGGLVVVGSYVPQTTAQLERLLALPGIRGFELDVPSRVAYGGHKPGPRQLAEAAAQAMSAGQVAVVFTSRSFMGLAGKEGPLATGRIVGEALCDLLRALPLRPAYIIAKGGITSHDLAQHGLGCQRATVLGQIAAGVPVWRLDRALRFENLPYVVFPGNVGQPGTLAELVEQLVAYT